MAQITLIFTTPEPEPLKYLVAYREVGTSDYQYKTLTGPSPLVIDNLPSGRYWEGYVQSKCGFFDASKPVPFGPITDVVQEASVLWEFILLAGGTGFISISVNGTEVATQTSTTQGSLTVPHQAAVEIRVNGVGDNIRGLQVYSGNAGANIYQQESQEDLLFLFVAQSAGSYTIKGSVQG